MSHTTIQLVTPSGTMSTELLVPEGAGPFGAVLLVPDAGGPRPAITAIGARIAKMGYLVAIPDVFFRSGSPIDAFSPDKSRDAAVIESIFADPAKRKRFFSEFYGPAIDYENLREVVTAVIGALEGRGDFNGKIGTTGYCMGGNGALRIAALFGARIAAAAAFHGGGLVTPQPDSPHLRAKDIAAKVYVAGAIEDGSFTDEAKATLGEAFAAANIDATVETYPARHGFVVPDNRAYDAAAAQRHDEALAKLFEATLNLRA